MVLCLPLATAAAAILDGENASTVDDDDDEATAAAITAAMTTPEYDAREFILSVVYVVVYINNREKRYSQFLPMQSFSLGSFFSSSVSFLVVDFLHCLLVKSTSIDRRSLCNAFSLTGASTLTQLTVNQQYHPHSPSPGADEQTYYV